MVKKPWLTKDKRLICKNPWFSVFEDNVERPDKSKGIYNRVEFRDGSLVIPLDEDGNIYLTNEYAYPVGKYLIQCVKGGVGENETPLEAAKRELSEELGITADEWVNMGFIYALPSYTGSKGYMFLARNLKFFNNKLENTELIEPVKVKLKTALQWVYEGKINNSVANLLIIKINNYLRESR